MDLYCVYFDAYGDDDFAEVWDHEPSERELQEISQTMGYHFAGCYQASSEQEALALAEREFDGGGCVA